ncbi:MAG: alkaline phosphatase family protein [Deltaproteobacteria bacterium]|nr:alkaline phosphatase family protein [Deltaproteobacteria bacterium]
MFTRSVMILADGARADVFEELLAAGRLPHIARHIVSRGAYRRGVTAFPSTTGPAYMPFLTGCLPATCNVPGIRWMDKAVYGRGPKRKGRRSYVGIETFRINADMRPEIATLFALLPRSYSVFNAVCRGTRLVRNLTRVIRIWYWYYAHLTDRWGFVDAAATRKLTALLSRDFRFAFIVFPGIDEYAHLATPRHSRVLAAYEAVDRAVGMIAARLRRLGRYDETLLWVVSDHGLSATHTHCCLNTLLERRGVRTLYYPLIYRGGCVAANMMSGNGMTHLYFRHPNGWEHPFADDELTARYPWLIDDLFGQPAVDLVAMRAADGWIHIRSRRGRARLHLDGTTVSYRVQGTDPFGYASLPERLGADEVLARTIDTDYPDGLYQLAHLFTSPRTGDVVVSATPGYDLRDCYEIPAHKGSHGSLHREHMHVPIACSAPLANRPMRTVDVFSTLLTAMGHALPTGIDGSAIPLSS